MTPYITETLAEINSNPDLLKTKYKDDFTIRTLMQYAFGKSLKFILPEGEPPYKKDAAPIGMSPSNFYQQVKKLYIFIRKDLSPVRREQLFIQLLEGLHPDEADILVHVKDQILTQKYKNITPEVIEATGWIKEGDMFRLEPTREQTIEATQTTTEVIAPGQGDEQVKKRPGRPKKVVGPAEPIVEVRRRRGRPKKVD